MKALKRKWNSRRGASILLALLFLLICMMAGASVVMAAASNAGKIRSNKEEQQKYLTLISAVTLLCDELQSVEYVGRYTITTTGPKPDEVRPKPGKVDSDDYENDYYKNTTYTYTWRQGDLRPRETGAKIVNNHDWTKDTYGNLQSVLPLFENWEYSFAMQQFYNDRPSIPKGNDYEDKVVYEYDNTSISSVVIPQDEPYTLTLTVEGVAGISGTVSVTVTPSQHESSDSITLEASFDGLVVKATLEPTGGKGPKNLKLPEPPEYIGSWEELTDEEGNVITDEDGNPLYKYDGETKAVTWELIAIEKVQNEEVLADDETP